MVEAKDVVIAILGASAGLAGFVLVFLGIVIASFQSYAGDVAEEVVRPYQTAGAILLTVFGVCLFVALIAVIWLATGAPSDSYGLVVFLFIALLALVFGAAAWTTRMVLWR